MAAAWRILVMNCMPRKAAMENELSRVVDSLPGSVEDASRAREAHDRSVADSIPAFLTFMTATGEVERVNRQVLEYIGATPETLRQWSTSDIVHPDDLASVVAAWTRSVATGEPYEIEHRIRRADGVYRWFHVRGLPLRDTEGTVIRWHVLQTDIDDRKRAEALLAGENRVLEMVASGRPLRAVLEALCEVADATVERGISSVALPEPTRHRVGTVIGAHVPEGYRRSLAGGVFEYDDRPCGRAARSKTQVIVSDVHGDPEWAATDWAALARAYGLESCWATPIVSLSGELLGVFTIYRLERAVPAPFDETVMRHFTHLASIALERDQHDEALRRSEAFLLEAQRISATGSFSWLVSTDDIVWSEPVYRMFEIDPGVPITFALIGSRVHPDDLPLLNDMIDRARSGASHVEYEHRLLMADGSVKHLRLIAHGRYDGGDRLEYIGAVQDVTARRQADDAVAKLRSDLAHVSRAATLGTLTASIAHEVNQPLSGIVTNASTCLRMLGADPPNVDGARETARRTIRDAGRASDVIARLRALFGGKTFTPESIDLNEAAREVMALVARELRQSHVTLDADLAGDLAHVTGDRVQLQQVVLNLLLNAAEAMSEVHDRPRQVVVRTEAADGECVRLSVRDVGVGFAAQDAERLFDAFYTTKSSGMGIGLSVSRAIIESHHGRLWGAANEGPGATFAFVIPRTFETDVNLPGAMRALAGREARPVAESPSW